MGHRLSCVQLVCDVRPVEPVVWARGGTLWSDCVVRVVHSSIAAVRREEDEHPTRSRTATHTYCSPSHAGTSKPRNTEYSRAPEHPMRYGERLMRETAERGLKSDCVANRTESWRRGERGAGP